MVTDRYAAFADYYGVTIVPTRPGRPRDKAAVERAVKIAYTKILGYFSNEVFYSLDELNEAIACRLADINSAMTRPDGTTRHMRFDKEEAPMMRDLPATPFTEVSYKRLKVDRNWHITCDYQYYSVPFQLVGESVTVRLTPQLVSVFNGEQLVAEHTRLHGGLTPGKWTRRGVSYAALVSVADASASKSSGARRLHHECRRRVL